MKQSHKLVLDILMGAVIPILVLNNLSSRLGAPTAYVIAALIPVGWVAVDLFFITRRLNFITVMAGMNAMASGALAFWFVDGMRYAVKDSAALILTALLFGGSIVAGRPILSAFFRQVVNPDTPQREQSLARLLAIADVARALTLGTAIVAVQTLLSTAVNIVLNLQIVQASFGTDIFNQQVATVNAITRVAFPVLSMLGFVAAIWLTYRAVYRHLPSEEGKSQLESEFWTLVDMWEHGPDASAPEAAASRYEPA